MRLRRAQRGFTLIEVLVSALILGVGVMAVVKVYTAGARGRREARHRELAVRMVERRIETLDARGSERLPACPGPEGCRDEAGEPRPPKPRLSGFPCTQVVNEPSLLDPYREDQDGALRIDTTVMAHPDPEQRAEGRVLSVSACWRDGTGNLRQYSMRRLVLEGAVR